MNIKETIDKKINRIAETHFFIKPVLTNSLKKQTLNQTGKAMFGNFNTYYEVWKESFSEKFYDMGTFIRLGSIIECSLRDYYMDKRGYSTLQDFKTNDLDLFKSMGIFQRVQNHQIQAGKRKSGTIELYRQDLSYNLQTNPHLSKIQEFMVNRHLYTHNSGLMNDKYLADFKLITGIDLTQDSEFQKQNYPNEDCYWFRPLNHLNNYIEEARKFFALFP